MVGFQQIPGTPAPVNGAAQRARGGRPRKDGTPAQVRPAGVSPSWRPSHGTPAPASAQAAPQVPAQPRQRAPRPPALAPSMEMAGAILSAQTHLEGCQAALENWGLDDEAGVIAQAVDGIKYAVESLGTLPEGWTPPPGGAPLGEGSIVQPNSQARAHFGAALEGVDELEVVGRSSPQIYIVSAANGPHLGMTFLIQRDQFTVKKRVKPAPDPTPQMDLEEEIAARQAQAEAEAEVPAA